MIPRKSSALGGWAMIFRGGVLDRMSVACSLPLCGGLFAGTSVAYDEEHPTIP